MQTQTPISGFESSPLITNEAGLPVTTDSFSCDGEIPGYAVNCVGNTSEGYETIAGQFALSKKLCSEPRIEPKLTVAYAYLNEKKVITQAISGPFSLGRPHDCPAAAHAGKAGKVHGKGAKHQHQHGHRGAKGHGKGKGNKQKQ